MSLAKPIVNLYDESESGITEVMAGPWKEIRVIRLTAGETQALHSTGEEHAGFVLSGSSVLRLPGGAEYPLGAGGAFALPLTGAVEIAADDAGLTLLLITLTVPEAA